MTEFNIISSPRHVDIAITGRCNLNCAYCFYADEMTARTDLPTEVWLKFFDQLGQIGVMSVTLTGGEAFTRPDFFELVDGVINNRMRYSILSNGTLINEKTIEKFNLGSRRKRLNSIQISIDGSTAAIHDQSRPHSFKQAVKALHLLKQNGFPLTVRVTINKHNYQDLANTARLLLEDVGLSSFSTNEAYPCGATNRYEEEIMLNPKQRKQVMQILANLLKKYPGRISATAGPMALMEQDKLIKESLAKGKTSLPGRGYLSSCGGVFTQMGVMHDGSMVPCHVVSTLVMGNILNDDLGEVWRNHPTMQRIRERREISLDKIEICKDCPYKGFCAGGCPGGALFLNGNIMRRNPMDCYRILMGKEEFNPSPAKNSNIDNIGDILE